MRALNRFFSRLWNFSSGRRGDERLREEMEEHLAMQTETNLRAGMSPEEARRQARLKFGGMEGIRERYHAEEGAPFLEGLLRDFRYAFRVLGKSTGFAIAAILILALGIGANLTVFLVLYGVLLKPLPFPHPRQLVRIERSYAGMGGTFPAYSGTQALFFRRANHSFQSMAAYDFIPSHANLLHGDNAVSIAVRRVTSDFFRTFDLPPAIGRGFTAKDMVPNAAGVVVLSDTLWRRQFNGDPNILGKGVTIGDRSYTVVGVANPRFALDMKSDAWTPLPIVESPEDKVNFYNLVGRLKPGITTAQATSDLDRVMREMKNIYPALWSRTEATRVIDLHDSFTGTLRPALRLLMGAVALILIIVAANILGLLLTRAVARRHELGVRVALGATGWRMLRQLLAENIVICVAGGIAGIAVARTAAPLLMHFSPIELPQFASMGIGGAAVALACVLALACAILFSVVPALETRPSRLGGSVQLNSTRIAQGRNTAQKILVVSEVAISLVLLVGAILLLTTFWKLVHTPPGFSADNVLTFKNSITDQQDATSAKLGLRLDNLRSRIEAVPGVESAAATISLPTQLTPNNPFTIIGRAANRSDSGGNGEYISTTAGLFRTLDIPVREGRAFTGGDTHGSAPVLIVNQEFARTYFPHESPIGQHVLIGTLLGPGFKDQIREIVGVVGDVKQDGLDQPAPVILYLPTAQVPDRFTQMDAGSLGESWMVRTVAGGVNVLPAIRKIFLDDSHTPLLSVEPLSEVVNASVAQQRFSMILLCGFGLISLVLGAAGLYGVMSYNVARRTREIGVRMALGAQRGDIARRMLSEAGWLVGIGLAIGIAAALAGTRILSSLLYGVTSRDPATLVAASVVLLAAALFSAWWPARRAARVEPMEALRTE